jgi:hypothetical protein
MLMLRLFVGLFFFDCFGNQNINNKMKIIGFQVSKTKGKKIDALLENDRGEIKRVPFGQRGSTTYSNRTGIKIDKVHNDEKLRKNYLARHSNDGKKEYTAGWFSKRFLWN